MNHTTRLMLTRLMACEKQKTRRMTGSLLVQAFVNDVLCVK